MSVVTYKGVYAIQTTVNINGDDIEAWEAKCIVKGCHTYNIGYVVHLDDVNKNTLQFDIPGGTCDHFMPREFYSYSDFENDAVISFGIVEDTDEQFKPSDECWNLV